MLDKQREYFRKRTRIDVSLVLFAAYIAYLMFLLAIIRDWKQVLAFHVLAVTIYCLVRYGRDYLYIILAPVMPFAILVDCVRLRPFLKKQKVNQHTETVVVLAHSDWRKLDAWINPNFSTGELEYLAKLLREKGRDFSFLVHAKPADVEKVMADPRVREVYFYGHGSAHMFKLDTNNTIYYCDFADGKYAKDFVHQIHCGTRHGKSLVDYVVPSANHDRCFLMRKPVTAIDIGRELKKMALRDGLGRPRITPAQN
jgi:hypothetical protein